MRWPPALETSFEYSIRYDAAYVIVVISLCQPSFVVEGSHQGQYLHSAFATDEMACRQRVMHPPLLSQHRSHMEVHNIITRMNDSVIFVDKASTLGSTYLVFIVHDGAFRIWFRFKPSNMAWKQSRMITYIQKSSFPLKHSIQEALWLIVDVERTTNRIYDRPHSSEKTAPVSSICYQIDSNHNMHIHLGDMLPI